MATLESEEVNSSATPITVPYGKTLCSPCDTDGKRLEAVGYCVNCKEYLCQACFKYHRLPSLTRKHVLLEQQEMESMEGSFKTCPKHEKQAVEYHCPTHNFVGCHLCFYHHQKTCRDSRYIPDVAQTLDSSSEIFIQLSEKLDHVAKKTEGLIIKAKQNLITVDKRHTEEVAAVRAFKKEVLEAVERLEKDILSRVDSLKRAEHAKWEDVISRCASIQDVNLTICKKIKTLKNPHENVDLYIDLIISKGKLLSLEDQLNAIENICAFEVFNFEGKTELQEILLSPFGLGKLFHSSVISSAEHITDIKVKTGEDNASCCIKGSALMPGGKLVIGDERNKKIKLVDMRKNEVVSEMTVSKSPWGVTKVSDTTAAVTVPGDKKIVFLRTDPALSVDRELSVREECHGVAYCDMKLVVTFRDKNMVHLLDFHGTVLREFQTDNKKALFNNPSNVAVNPAQKLIYVSNSGYGYYNIVCLQLGGNVVATYKDSELRYPQQAVAGSTGMVFVIGNYSVNVHVITHDCKKIKILLSSTNGLVNPETISYDERRRRLYVGDKDIMKVYRVSYSLL